MEVFLTIPAWSVIEVERLWLRDTAKMITEKFAKPIIVNIGVLYGATTHCLRAGSPTALLYGIDIDYDMHPVQYVHELHATLIQGDSGKCHSDFDEPIHLLFIDGDHHYEGVVADIDGWLPKVVPGGIVAFHDYNPEAGAAAWIGGVQQAVDAYPFFSDWDDLPGTGSIRAFQRRESE